MTLLRRAFSTRSVENPGVPLTSESLVEWLDAGHRTEAGVAVNEHTALGFGPVWRAVALISGLGGALPLHAYRDGTHDRVPSPLLSDPHPELTPYEFWRLNYAHRLLWGNAYAQKVYARSGQLRHLYPIRPSRVSVSRSDPSDDNPSGKWFRVLDDSDRERVLTTREILHIPGLGYDGVSGMSPVHAARQAIGLGLAAERYGAKLFGSGALMAGILKTQNRLQPADARRLRSLWREATAGLDNQHSIPVLDSGAAFEPLTMPNDDAQFLETRHFQTTDVSRFFGVPPFLLMETEKSTSWGTGLEQQAQGFVTFDLHPQWLAPTEQRVTKELLGDGVFCKYSVEGLLRGDSTARAAFYTAMRHLGVLSANEIRALEDRPPIEGGDTYIEPMNMRPLGDTDEGGPSGSDPADD